jgi:hypothetical protein
MTLTILFLIIAVILLYIGCKKENTAYIAIGSTAAIAFLFCLIGWIASYYNFKTYIHEYEVTKTMVESYKGQDYGNMTALTKSVVKINNKIADHKALSNSILLKGFYSKEVGDLKPITFNMRE